ncbi:MAG: DUF6498-containing protein [Pseudomonadota bacterium]
MAGGQTARVRTAVASPSQSVAISLGALLLVNLIPLIGVFVWNWRVFDILLLFWAENLVIGAITVLRMLTVTVTQRQLKGIGMIPFFTIHYGGFCAVHGVFLFVMFGNDGIGLGAAPTAIASEGNLLLPVAALAASHLVSFIVNFLWAGEYQRVTVDKLMFLPYPRVVILHVVIIFGGFAIAQAGEPVFALVLLIALKTGLDAMAHIREHRALQATSSAVTENKSNRDTLQDPH